MRQFVACATMCLAAIAAAHQADTTGLGMWLAYVLLGVTVLLAAGPVGDGIGRWSYRWTWGRRQVTLITILVGVVAGVVQACLVNAAVQSYWSERESIKRREADDKRRRDEQSSLLTALASADRRSDATDKLRNKQLEKYQEVSNLLAEAIKKAGTLRAKVDDDMSKAMAKGALPAFDATFDRTYTPAIEAWRAETEAMLERELPGQGLGEALRGRSGDHGKGRAGARLGQIKACVDFLHSIQQNLRAHVEAVVHG